MRAFYARIIENAPRLTATAMAFRLASRELEFRDVYARIVHMQTDDTYTTPHYLCMGFLSASAHSEKDSLCTESVYYVEHSTARIAFVLYTKSTRVL